MIAVCRFSAATLFVFILFALVSVAGCGGHAITQSDFEDIKNGMSLSQVEEILGKGKEHVSVGGTIGGISMDTKSMVWQDGNQIITVIFLNGEVMGKSQVGIK